jgi:hypothetical protein
MTKLFVSTMLYAAAKKLGYLEATNELMRQAGAIDPAAGDHSGIPAALTIARVASLEPVQLNVNAGATVIGKARSLAAKEFLASKADTWLSCDDDVSASTDALQTAISQARAEPCLVIVPCLLRNTTVSKSGPIVNLRAAPVSIQSRAPSGGKVETVDAGGFGCFAVSRAVVERVHKSAGEAADFRFEGGFVRSLFRDEIIDHDWVTEDLAFCRRVAALGYPRWAVRVGSSVHAGQRLDLATLDALLPRVGSNAVKLQ